MNGPRLARLTKMLVPGVALLQLGGCIANETYELFQTIFLGITAAGSIAILQNI